MPLLLWYSAPPFNFWYEPYDYTNIIEDEIRAEQQRAREDALLLLWWEMLNE